MRFFLPAALVIAFSAKHEALAQFALPSNTLPRAPRQIILGCERIANQGAVRIFDARTGALVSNFSYAAWTDGGAGRQVAVNPSDDHLWVRDGFEDLYEFDTANNYVRSFNLDASAAGNPGGDGINGFAFEPGKAVGSGQRMFVCAKWSGCAVSWLFVVDPATGTTIGAMNFHTDPNTPGFCANRMSVGRDPFAAAWEDPWAIYVTESQSPGQGRVAVVKIGLLGTPYVRRVIAPPTFANHALQEVEALSDGALLVADVTSKQLFLSDRQQVAWQVVPFCPMTITGSFGGLAGMGGFGNYTIVTGGNICNISQRWQVSSPLLGPNYQLDASANGMFAFAPADAALR